MGRARVTCLRDVKQWWGPTVRALQDINIHLLSSQGKPLKAWRLRWHALTLLVENIPVLLLWDRLYGREVRSRVVTQWYSHERWWCEDVKSWMFQIKRWIVMGLVDVLMWVWEAGSIWWWLWAVSSWVTAKPVTVILTGTDFYGTKHIYYFLLTDFSDIEV